MKKVVFVILCLYLAISVCASASESFQFEYQDQCITIIFDENTNFTNDERQYVADLLVYGTPDTNDTSTYAWCWLTGHDLTSEAVAEVQHKISATAPRCYQTIYEVTTCSKCDHVETTKLASSYISCCPED